MANLRVNDKWFTDSGAAFGELQWSSRNRGGSEAASWRVDSLKRLPYRPGQSVQIVEMGVPVWSGTLLEPDGDTFHARGLYYQATRAKALDSGNATATPSIGISQAIAREVLTWGSQESFGSAPIGDVSEPLFLSELLDNACAIAEKTWRVDPRGNVAAVAPATTPSWYVAPGAAQLTVAEDSYVTTLFGRYLDSTTGNYATVTATDTEAATRFGPREDAVDLSKGGALSLSAGSATAILESVLKAGAARPGWANSLRLASWELTTAGDAKANLRRVKGGDMIRILGQMDMTIASGPKPYVDVIADEVTYVDGSEFIDIKPVGLEARTFTDVLALALG